MKKLCLILSIFSSLAFARTANQVFRMPSSGNVPGYGAVNLASSAAVTGILPVANGGSGAGQVVPSGVIWDFAGTSGNIPAGWFQCDGTSYSTSTYAALFAAIGYTWGGSGANFNVPDFRGRTLVGVGTGQSNYLSSGNATLTARALAAIFGEETHLLTAGESGLQSHNHSISDPGHNHTEYFHNGAASGGGYNVTQNGTNASYNPIASSMVTASNTTGIGVNTVAGASAGSGHNNMQPTAAVYKIIKQ